MAGPAGPPGSAAAQPIEKALLPWRGQSLLAHTLARLSPQVGACAISANRALERYAAHGLPVWPDADPEAAPGPLAGWLAALQAMPTPWLLSVPCDTPHLPTDLADRLVAALARGASVAPEAPPLAIATTADGPQPVFALLHRSLAAPLAQALAQGQRGVGRFAQAQGAALAHFDDAGAFADADTPEALAQLQQGAQDGRHPGS